MVLIEVDGVLFGIMLISVVITTQACGTSGVCGVDTFCNKKRIEPRCDSCQDFASYCFTSNSDPACMEWCKRDYEEKTDIRIRKELEQIYTSKMYNLTVKLENDTAAEKFIWEQELEKMRACTSKALGNYKKEIKIIVIPIACVMCIWTAISIPYIIYLRIKLRRIERNNNDTKVLRGQEYHGVQPEDDRHPRSCADHELIGPRNEGLNQQEHIV